MTVAAKDLGHAALQGWRAKAADHVASAVGKRTPFDEERVRALLGLLFLGLTVRYLVRTAREAFRS